MYLLQAIWRLYASSGADRRTDKAWGTPRVVTFWTLQGRLKLLPSAAVAISAANVGKLIHICHGRILLGRQVVKRGRLKLRHVDCDYLS